MDLIDREEAIKALTSSVILVTNNNVDAVKKVMELFIDKIRNLPAAEPDTDEWCTDCSEYDQEHHCCPRWNRVIRETLKEAQPERKTGRWIHKGGGMASSWNYCSVCGNQQIYRYDFCPNCGADMRGDTDGDMSD